MLTWATYKYKETNNKIWVRKSDLEKIHHHTKNNTNQPNNFHTIYPLTKQQDSKHSLYTNDNSKIHQQYLQQQQQTPSSSTQSFKSTKSTQKSHQTHFIDTQNQNAAAQFLQQMHGNSLSQTHTPQLNQTEQKQSNSELQTNINKNIQDSQPSYFLPQQLSHTEPQLQQMSLIDTIEQFQKNNHFPEK